MDPTTPIPFIVEDGTIVLGANSLVSVEFADAVAATDYMLGQGWLAITTTYEKQLRLIAATQWLKDNVIWRGDRVTDPLLNAEALPWEADFLPPGTFTPVTFDQSEAEPQGITGEWDTNLPLTPPPAGTPAAPVGPVPSGTPGTPVPCSPGGPRFRQSLDWPRRGAYDRETRRTPPNVVPPEVQMTAAKVAMYFISQAAQDANLVGVQTFRADTFELIFQQGYMGRATPAWIGYGLYGLGQVVSAPGTKKIRRG